MELIDRLKGFIHEHDLLETGDRVLLAVSGGRDSMLMAYLFSQLPYDCIIAHCNFNLRGKESDKDEALVREMGEKWKIPVFVKHFNTIEYAREARVSTQMAARELRYQWFEGLSEKHHCRRIAIAQHGNDHLETALLNLTRGTGIRGLAGIKIKRDVFIRPLLFLSAEEVTCLVGQLSVPYRDDQSNFSTQYTRNKIRLEIIPKFKEIQPDFEHVMRSNIRRFDEAHAFIQRTVDAIRNELLVPCAAGYRVDKQELGQYIDDPFLVYELFKPFGFNRTTTDDLIGSYHRQSGATFNADHYELLLDRACIFLRQHTHTEGLVLEIEEVPTTVKWADHSIEVLTADCANQEGVGAICERVDADQLIFPLSVRSWQQGDRFQPLGMKGRKKVSDFFIQQKIDRFEKERIPILLNGNGEIIWIVGLRLDNRYKITENTKKVLTFVFK